MLAELLLQEVLLGFLLEGLEGLRLGAHRLAHDRLDTRQQPLDIPAGDDPA